MTRKGIISPEAALACCEGKARFRTEDEATSLTGCRRSTVVSAYRCPVCNGWHLTGPGHERAERRRDALRMSRRKLAQADLKLTRAAAAIMESGGDWEDLRTWGRG
ncbi:hypothetical protein [Paracoccus sp. SM22M-07]|uniref:hypothetical protein n=1 Tax=Paracoccus sp. SM22M-07 TaxID=1520813 RepID=UPI000923D424|nr:hypothetical protein [Paracoccus sp. SM22M-07]OJH45177.1 hypothetical protein IE00_05810 [Paracoccus sp. SM22M-07]